MVKIALVALIAMVAVTYFNDPTSFKPWEEAASHVGEIVAKSVKNTGEAANKFIRDEAHKDSLIEKAKDAVSDAGSSARQAVTGK